MYLAIFHYYDLFSNIDRIVSHKHATANESSMNAPTQELHFCTAQIWTCITHRTNPPVVCPCKRGSAASSCQTNATPPGAPVSIAVAAHTYIAALEARNTDSPVPMSTRRRTICQCAAGSAVFFFGTLSLAHALRDVSRQTPWRRRVHSFFALLPLLFRNFRASTTFVTMELSTAAKIGWEPVVRSQQL